MDTPKQNNLSSNPQLLIESGSSENCPIWKPILHGIQNHNPVIIPSDEVLDNFRRIWVDSPTEKLLADSDLYPRGIFSPIHSRWLEHCSLLERDGAWKNDHNQDAQSQYQLHKGYQ